MSVVSSSFPLVADSLGFTFEIETDVTTLNSVAFVEEKLLQKDCKWTWVDLIGEIEKDICLTQFRSYLPIVLPSSDMSSFNNNNYSL